MVILATLEFYVNIYSLQRSFIILQHLPKGVPKMLGLSSAQRDPTQSVDYSWFRNSSLLRLIVLKHRMVVIFFIIYLLIADHSTSRRLHSDISGRVPLWLQFRGQHLRSHQFWNLLLGLTSSGKALFGFFCFDLLCSLYLLWFEISTYL